MAVKAGKKSKGIGDGKLAAQNRKARHDYLIENTLEAGIALVGTEVKSLRQGHASITEFFAREKAGEIFLFNAHIPEYGAARHFGHEPRRPRKLLLRQREIRKLIGAVRKEGMTLGSSFHLFQRAGICKGCIGDRARQTKSRQTFIGKRKGVEPPKRKTNETKRLSGQTLFSLSGRAWRKRPGSAAGGRRVRSSAGGPLRRSR